MQNTAWDKAKQIFEDLADCPSGERTALLEQACDGDTELRASIEKLLAAHERAGEFLRDPTLNAATLVQAADSSHFLSDTRAGRDASSRSAGLDGSGRAIADDGRRIGRYKLLEMIGEGGFGAVYMAEQIEPVRRRVALKIIKAGMDSRQIVARFEAERQALALMDHSNIAKVLDGGESESGRPYFVMELVRGVPITQFCDQQRLTMRERLDLFLPVCQAVQHAHQKGIIHRDIKPTNVLVTLHDGKPVPKVIDFGIAKAMHTPLTEKTLFTEFRQLIGTPTYMSPEQAEMSGLDVDTRSDIYSLGVLLYELLTGTTPFDARKLLNAGYAELQRTIKEVEPQRPSTRVSSAARTGSRLISADGSPENSPVGAGTSTIENIAHQRRTDAQSLCRLLRGDLDWIVMKCLEKDRSRRYGTASDLAADVDRYLRDELVAARPPSTMYKLQKLARRNRTAVFAAAAIVAALGVGFAASLAGFLAARDAQRIAEQQQRSAETHALEAQRAAARSEAVNKFLQEMLAAADPAQGGKREMSVRDALDRAVARLDAGALKSQPEIEASVRLTIGRTYGGIAEFDAGKVQLDAAVEMVRRLYGDQHAEFADALHQRASLLLMQGDAGAAEIDMRAALEIDRRVLSPDAIELAATLNDVATCILDPERLPERESLLNEALRIARLPRNAGESILADVLNNLAFAPKGRKEWDKAESMFREALAVNRTLRGDSHPCVATNLDNIAQVLDNKGDSESAERTYREALQLRRTAYGSDHPDVGMTLHNLATLLWRKKEPAECEAALRESLEIFRRVHGLIHPDTLTVLDSLVAVVGARGDLDTAEALLLEAFEAIKDDPRISAARKAAFATRLVELYSARNQPDLVGAWKETAARFAALAN